MHCWADPMSRAGGLTTASTSRRRWQGSRRGRSSPLTASTSSTSRWPDGRSDGLFGRDGQVHALRCEEAAARPAGARWMRSTSDSAKPGSDGELVAASATPDRSGVLDRRDRQRRGRGTRVSGWVGRCSHRSCDSQGSPPNSASGRCRIAGRWCHVLRCGCECARSLLGDSARSPRSSPAPYPEVAPPFYESIGSGRRSCGR